jgi:hypothetical protein
VSASSNNIIIKITDGVDANIAVKIQGIGAAAQQSTKDVLTLTASLSLLSNNTTTLTNALNALNTAQKAVNQTQNTTVNSTNGLTRSFANLVARIAAAELGAGRFGGVVASLGTAAAGAGPFIVAALAVAAVVAAIEVYDKYEESARKLTEAQIDVAKTNNTINDSLLKEKETLIGLTQGPLAQYQAELNDISQKSLNVQIADINKEFDVQKSTLATIISFLERYGSLVPSVGANIVSLLHPQKTTESFSIQNAEDFVAQEEKIRQQGTQLRELSKQDLQAIQADAGKASQSLAHNQELSLASEIANLKDAIGQKQKLLEQQDGTTRSITERGIAYLQSVYNRDLVSYQEYLAKKKTLTAEVGQKQAEEQIKQFQDEVNRLNDRQQKTTPQELLELRKSQLAGTARPTTVGLNLASQAPLTIENQRALEKAVASAQQAVDRQNQSLENLVNRYKEQTEASAAYSDKLKEEAAYQKANDEVVRITGSLQQDVLQRIYREIDAQIESTRVNKEKLSVYQQFNGPLLQYNAALKATADLVKDQAITQVQANIANAEALRIYNNAVNPLNEYNIGLEHETQLLGLYGRELTVATEVDRIRQDLQKQGRDLTQDQISQYTKILTQLESLRNIQQNLNDLWEQNAGTIQKLTEYQIALNQAQAKGVITQQQYKIATAQNNIALANQHLLEQQGATLRQQLIVTFGNYLKNYQGLTKGLTDAYAQAFTQIADGAGNAIGRAIVYGENLHEALANVGRTIATDLISAFVKLGIQWLLTEAIGKSVAASTTTSAIATASAIGAAWAPAAAFASLATLGGNAAPATAAVAGTVGFTEALNLLKFAKGGLVSGPGSGTSDSVIAALSNGEFVVNAKSTSENLGLLKAINSNSNSRPYSAPGSVGSSGTNLLVQVIHDGSTNVSVNQLDEGTVRIIAQREARKEVQANAAGVVASDLGNPNSRTSKAVQQHLNAPRKR